MPKAKTYAFELTKSELVAVTQALDLGLQSYESDDALEKLPAKYKTLLSAYKKFLKPALLAHFDL